MPLFFKNPSTHKQNTHYFENNFTFLPTPPFYGKSEAGFFGESKIKKTPSPNRQKIPHFWLNTIFLSIFTIVTCIPFYYPIALTNFKKIL